MAECKTRPVQSRPLFFFFGCGRISCSTAATLGHHDERSLEGRRLITSHTGGRVDGRLVMSRTPAGHHYASRLGMAPARGVAAIIRLAVAPPGFVASNRTLLSRGKNARQPNLKVLYSPRRWDNEAAAHSEAPGARRQTKPSLLRCVPSGAEGAKKYAGAAHQQQPLEESPATKNPCRLEKETSG
jgi:hypothetical protein